METKTYFFGPDSHFFKQGFYMQDENKNIVYEAKMLKQSLIGSMNFEFNNHVSNKVEEHKIGHTLTTEESGIFGAFSTKSSFKYDGKNIWDYLHEEGIRIDSSLAKGKIGMSYTVSLKGNVIATIEMASMNGKSIITNNHCFNVTTNIENIDLVFLTTFAIARTEQTFYD